MDAGNFRWFTKQFLSMRVGVIVEGRSDAAVITNILKGKLNISKSDIQYLVPEFDYDETTLFQMRKEQFSNWTIVKQTCENRQKISDFIDIVDSDRFVVIHIDSDTRNEVGYEVVEPILVSNIDEMSDLRKNISDKLCEWLAYQYVEKIAFAIAIREIDAWLITIYSDINETGLIPNPKERFFNRIINEPNRFTQKEKLKIFRYNDDKFEQYSRLTKDFRNERKLEAATVKNLSLKRFCEELEKFSLRVL